MKAMILAAGYGTRLRPLTESLPKPLLPILGAPLIVWNLLLLRQHGLTDVIINLHHLGHLIEKELGDGSRFDMRLSYSREPVVLGTGGGMKEVEPFFGGEPFLVLNGDTVLELDCQALIRFHTERGGLATMVVRDDPDVEQWGAVEVDAQQRVVSINGQGRGPASPTRAHQRRMFAGVHVVHPRVLRDMPRGQESSIIDAYIRALAQGAMILGYEMDGYWSDVGTPERYAKAQRDAQAGLINLAARREANCP